MRSDRECQEMVGDSMTRARPRPRRGWRRRLVRHFGSARDLRFMFQSRNRIAYVGWVGHSNMGDEAIFEVCRKAFVGHRLDQVPFGSSFDRAARWSGRPLMTAALLGGGTLVGRYPMYRRPFERWRKEYPHLPMFAFGVGVADPDFERRIDGFDVSRELSAWRKLFQEFELVTVRGPRSQEILAAAGIESTIVGDPALLVASSARVLGASQGLLGLNLGVSQRLSDVDWAKTLQEIMRFARTMVARGWRVRFVPVFAGDVPYVNEAAEMVGPGAEIAQGWDRLPTLLDAIAECDVFVGVKLHSVVFAAALGVPSVSLAYEPKCSDFLASIGLERFAIPLTEVRSDDVASVVEELEQDRDRYESTLREAVTTRQEALRLTITEMQARLNASPVHSVRRCAT